MKIFVYGSLRKNKRNHHLISNISNFIGKFYIKGSLYMVKNAYYPALILENNNDYTVGELYVIDEKQDGIKKALELLDTLEHYFEKNSPENEYNKILVEVYDDHFQKVDNAYAYIYNIENNPKLKDTLGEKIKENDYLNIKDCDLE